MGRAGTSGASESFGLEALAFGTFVGMFGGWCSREALRE